MKKLFLLSALLIFACSLSAQVVDAENNSYEIISISEQEWLSSNLIVKQYTDGTPIPEITTTSAWASATTGAWCYVNSDPQTEEDYGILYNSYAIQGIHDNDESTPNKSIAMAGWKVPTSEEFNTLITEAGGYDNAGYGLKSQTGWNSFNGNSGNGDNSTGFNAFPAGNRQQNSGTYNNFGDNAVFWVENVALFYALNFVNFSVQVSSGSNQGRGQSLRLIKDNTAGLDDMPNLNFKIYPNPTSKTINVKWINNCNLTIFNTLGQIILQANNTKTIDVSSLSKGAYFIKVSDGINSKTKRFIKN
tara:strand:- start:51 stop:962 length:912 start_codon:yes stop_codon:yes gene_type:complete